MGCGSSYKGPQLPLYANEFSPPCYDLVPFPCAFPNHMPSSGTVATDLGIFFDDREIIKQCQIVQIGELGVFMERYVTGFEIKYYLDGIVTVLSHCGSKIGKKYVMPLSVDDSITSCKLSFKDNKIKSIRFESLRGLVMDVLGMPGHESHDKAQLELRTEKRAIVAFKGKVNEYIEGFSVYSWKILANNGTK